MNTLLKLLICFGIALFIGLYGSYQFGYGEETIIIVALVTLFGTAISLTQIEIISKLDEIKKKCSIK